MLRFSWFKLWIREAGIMAIAWTAQSRKKTVLSDVYNMGPCVPSFYHRAVNVAYPTLQGKVSQEIY